MMPANHRIVVAAVCIGLTASAQADAQALSRFGWKQGETSKSIQPVKTHVCALTMVKGKFRGNGEAVRVLNDGNFWSIGGASQQEGVETSAACYALSDFTTSAKPAERWISERFRARLLDDDKCRAGTKRTWLGDAATMISSFAGALRGGGEQARVEQSDNPNLPSQIVARSCSTQMDVTAHSLFVGKPGSGSRPRWIGPNGPSTLASAAEFAVTSNQSVTMAPTAQAMCFLTQVGGDFRGGGEFLAIELQRIGQQDRWVLKSQSKSGSGLFGRARCLALKQ